MHSIDLQEFNLEKECSVLGKRSPRSNLGRHNTEIASEDTNSTMSRVSRRYILSHLRYAIVS